MIETVQKAIKNICHDHSSIKEMTPVSGGSINDAWRVETDKTIYFVKTNEQAPKHFFKREKEGLTFLRDADAIDVPRVWGANDHAIVMEWVSGAKDEATDEKLGRALALLHSVEGPYFGLGADNYIGKLPQKNEPTRNWLDFYREQRLLPQVKLASERGLMPSARRKRLHKLLDSLDRWIPHDVKPRKLHGDLWGGNWITGQHGEPYLIDPAVFYGDPELDLAFSELFGGFSRRVYESYEEIHPISPDYEDRKPLYQLYYLLVHLNLFGESYGPSIDRILKHYT